MALCKHCQVESTLSAAGDQTCPHCGMPYDFADDDWELEAGEQDQAAPANRGDDFDGATPSDTAKEIEPALGEETEFFGDLPDQDATSPTSPTDSENLAGREAAVDMTHAFGGKFAEDDWDDVEEIALGAEEEDDDEHATAGPSDVTAPFIHLESDGESDSASSGGGSGTAREQDPDADLDNADATLAFDPVAGTDPSSSPGTGPDPGFGGETMGPGAPAPASPPAVDVPPAAGTGADMFGTLPAGLSGSDRGSDAGSAHPPSSDAGDVGTRGEDIGSRGSDSGTLAVDGDSNRRSDRVETPKPREITGLETGQTIPRGTMGDDQASQSLRPGDTHIVGPENVRLRAYRLGEDEKRGPTDFTIETPAFAGGMGVVYGMRQGSLDRRVAVKQVKPAMSSNESDRNKFISEAVITGQLEHPNIIPVHDLGLASDGLPFYSMKFVEGDEWEKRIKKLSEDENLAILIQVSQAIAFAHSRGIIHRDLKPGNVMLGGYGEVLVMDWGLAARLENAEDIPPSGTPVYMPPETALQYLDYAKNKMGRKQRQSTTRRVPPGQYSDIYLLGGLLFKIVTGRAPHRGKSTFECLKAAARNEIVKTSRRNELLDIAYKAMRTDPGQRHRDVNEFIDEIKAYQAHAQSNKIAKQANQDFKAAEQAKADPAVDTNVTYASYSSAQHGFRNALDLWEGNRRAARRLVETKRKYAETAYGNGDFDLALSLLDPEADDDTKMIAEVRSAQRQRSRRLQLFRTLQYAVAASLVVAIGFIALSIVLGLDAINQRSVADAAQRQAQTAKQEADDATREASAQLAKAKAAGERAVEAESMAADAQRDAEAAEKIRVAAVRAKDDAEQVATQARIDADNAKQAEAAAQRRKDEAERKLEQVRYAAVRNSVRSTLAERGAFAASKELRKTYSKDRDQELLTRGPEWEQLLNEVDWQAVGGAEEVLTGLAAPLAATNGDGSVSVVVDNQANAPRVSVYRGANFAAAAASWRIDTQASSVKVSPSGRMVAVIGQGLSLFTAEGAEIATPEAAGLPITTLAFDPRDGEFITGDKQTGVARWRLDADTATATLIDRDARWHRKPVTVVGYSPDGALRFDADTEGRISVWRRNGDALPTRWAYSHARASSGSPVITAAAMADHRRGGALTYGCRDGAVYVLRGPWATGQQPATTKQPAPVRFASSSSDNPGWIDERPDKLNTLHTSAVTSVAFAEKGCVIVSTGGVKALCRRASPNAKVTVERDREYHDSRVLSASTTADGRVLTTDNAGRVVRWSVAAKPNPARLEPAAGEARAPVTAIGVDPQQNAVVVGDGVGFLRRWDKPFTSRVYEKRFAGHEDHRRMRAWLTGGPTPRVVTVGADRLACLWDAQTGALQRTLDLDGRHVVTLSADSQSLIAATDLRVSEKPSAVALPLDGGPATPLWTSNPRVATLHAFLRPGDTEQTIAVGLRDGQVYLWTRSGGRQELVASTRRPHWRVLRTLAYDPRTDALLAIDNPGLVTRWSLSTGEITEAFAPGKGAPRRLDVGADRLLVVRDRLGSTTAQLIDPQTLRAIAAPGLVRSDLRDAAFSPSGNQVLALTTKGQLVAWTGDTWRPAGINAAMARPLADASPWTGLSIAADGALLLYGDGRAQRWSGTGRDAQLVARITSRSQPLAALPQAEGGVLALSRRGWLDEWQPREGKRLTNDQLAPQQRGVGAAETVLAACPAGPKNSFAAVATKAGAVIELRDLANGQPLGESYPVSSPRVAALDGNDAWLAAAIADPNNPRVELFPRNGGAPTTVRFDEPPLAVAVAPAGDRVAVLTRKGVAYAQRGNLKDQWTIGPLDREAVTAIEFTPTGDRLMTGDQTGQLAMLAIDPPSAPPAGDGAFSSRVVLTFTGHADAVSLLHFATLNGRPTLLSGDRSGAVLVKPL